MRKWNVFYCYVEEYGPTYCGVKTVKGETPNSAMEAATDLLGWEGLPTDPKQYDMLRAVEDDIPVYQYGVADDTINTQEER